MNKLSDLKKELRSYATPERKRALQRYFKTGPGEYAEGDIFLGIKVPDIRKLAKTYDKLSIGDIETLLHSKIHEERGIALFLLAHKFEKGDEGQRKAIFNLYLKNTKYINNWDLVDGSAGRIVGVYLENRSKAILQKLARSNDIWERRIAIIATSHYIGNDKFDETLKIAKMLLGDEHDLIHKATGWMLREIGKRSFEVEEEFLKANYKEMPRTMLRYAIERFPEKRRQAYLKGIV